MAKVINIKKEHLKKKGYDNLEHWLENENHIYIGRNMSFYVPGAVKSKWANPYSVKKYGRDECLKLYKKYVKDNLMDDLSELKGKVLGCWCSPEPCHGNVLINLIRDYYAIIGTAGRNEDGDKLTLEHYNFMYKMAKKRVGKTVISGGSAWVDHVAVRLFNRGHCEKLILYLPFQFKKGKFTDNYLNSLHKKFSDKCGIDSLAEISEAIDNGCKVIIGNGFLDRNTMIAKKCTDVLAFTFGSGKVPKPGGTRDTWDKVKHNNKVHVSLLNC